MPLKIIITGATGFVGEGVLLTCLQHPAVEEILMVNRKPFYLQHPKLKELIVPDFFQLEKHAANLAGYDTCFYCAGISSVGMDERKYTVITYDTTIHFAKTVLASNPDLVFNFISGSHTDSSEKGRIMWARVKGKTENALMKLGFREAYNFRPGGMVPIEAQHHAKPMYGFIVKLLRVFIPKRVSTLEEVGLAIINVALKGYPKQVLEVVDIVGAAR